MSPGRSRPEPRLELVGAVCRPLLPPPNVWDIGRRTCRASRARGRCRWRPRCRREGSATTVPPWSLATPPLVRAGSVAVASSSPSPVNRIVAAAPAKSFRTSPRRTAVGGRRLEWYAAPWRGRQEAAARRTEVAEVLLQAVEPAGEVVAGRRSGVQVDDAGVADRLGPLLVRRVVGQAGVLGLGDDLVDGVLRHRRRPPSRRARRRRRRRGRRRRRRACRVRSSALPSSLTWTTDDRVGVGVAEVDRGDRGPVAQPRVDVVGEGEAVAAEALDQLVAELLADVVDAVDPDLVLERRELVQRPERVDLLAAAGVEVDAGVGDGRRREGLGGLGTLLEERDRGPGSGAERQEADDAATDQPGGTTAPAARGRLASVGARAAGARRSRSRGTRACRRAAAARTRSCSP